jgi:carbonic anhydrase/acetyltransferase-like protein (isoleucine patch superfamily)
VPANWTEKALMSTIRLGRNWGVAARFQAPMMDKFTQACLISLKIEWIQDAAYLEDEIMPLYALGDDRPLTLSDDNYWVAPGAHVIGKVTIGVDVGIWFGAVLRGDNEMISIGAGSNIQEGVMVHTDMGYPATIGAGCTIGHHAIIHGCTIGNNSLVGMGATILNGAKIGNNCLVGANALITEGKEFPDNSLIVGAPAKAIRTLDEAAIEGLRRSAAGYVRNWKRFRQDMEQI